jgi:pyrroloquinoline-quinone synthase
MSEVCATIRQAIDAFDLNDNSFFRSFRAKPLSHEQLTFICQQYYLYIRTFPRLLAGLSHRVDSEDVRMWLARTVVSELGEGHGLPHFKLFERVLDSVGVHIQDYRDADYIPETIALVNGLKRIFLVESPVAAVGGHYTIEETGLPMIDSLYEGFRHYPGHDVKSMEYFHLHLFLEGDHVSWISNAVEDYAVQSEYREELCRGGSEVAGLLNQFWGGLYQHTYGAEKVDCVRLAS